METGWFTASYNGKNHWFYANQNGEMQTGWIMDCKNRWYSLKEDGTVRSHWYQEQGVWYYLGFDGEMRTGWTITEGSHNRWSYFEPNGAMVSDTTVMGADGTLYLINSDGYMVSNGTGREFYRDGNGDEYCVLEVGEVLTGWYLQSNVTLTSAGYDLLFDWIDHQEPNRDINPDRVVQRLQQFKNRYYFGPDGKRWTNLPETMSITSDIVMKQGKPYIEKFHQKIHMASPFTIVNQHLYYLEHEKTGELKPGYSVLIGSGPEFGVNILVYADNTGRILKMRRLSKDYLKDIHQVPMDGLNDDRILIDYNRDGQEVIVLDKE